MWSVNCVLGILNFRANINLSVSAYHVYHLKMIFSSSFNLPKNFMKSLFLIAEQYSDVRNNKNKPAHSRAWVQQHSALVAWQAMHWRAIANLFLSHGDSYSELHTPSTPQVPTVGVITMPTLCFKSPMAFVVHIRQTHALLPYLSLWNLVESPREDKREDKHHTNIAQKQW